MNLPRIKPVCYGLISILLCGLNQRKGVFYEFVEYGEHQEGPPIPKLSFIHLLRDDFHNSCHCAMWQGASVPELL